MQAIGSGWETYSWAGGGPADPGCPQDGSAASPGLQDNNDNGLGHPDKVSPQVDEVIGIMHKNVENVLERDRKLGDLEEREEEDELPPLPSDNSTVPDRGVEDGDVTRGERGSYMLVVGSEGLFESQEK